MASAAEVEQIVKDLLPYGPEKIILFGSAARGDADEHSDIDIIVIKETGERFVRRLVEAGSYLTLPRHVDLFVYSPEELGVMVAEGNPFILGALRDGKIIYEKLP